MTSPAVWLRDRAKSYARDAELLRSNGDTDDALVFEAIRDELRKCADCLLTGELVTPPRYRPPAPEWERKA